MIMILLMLVTRTATTIIFKRSLELRFYFLSTLSFLLVLLIELNQKQFSEMLTRKLLIRVRVHIVFVLLMII